MYPTLPVLRNVDVQGIVIVLSYFLFVVYIACKKFVKKLWIKCGYTNIPTPHTLLYMWRLWHWLGQTSR